MRVLPRVVIALSLVALFMPAALAKPTEWPARFAQIRGLLDIGNTEDAISEGEALTERAPDDASAWFWLGRAYGFRAMQASMFSAPGLAKKSRQALEKAIELNPKLVDAQFAMMQYLLMAPGFMGGDEDKAREFVPVIAAIDPTWGHLAAASVALQVDEDKAAAERAYRAALASDPNDLSAQISWSAFLLGEKRHDEVRAFWTERATATPENAVPRYFRARVSIEDGQQLDQALADVDAYLATPNKIREVPEAVAHWRRGLILEKLGRQDDALTAVRQAQSLRPDDKRIADDLERLGG
jgi:tetratricopeptide (TPR) repeat protein